MYKSSKSENTKPFVVTKLLLVCANCKRKASSEADQSTFKLCSGCYKVYYCNKECQLAHRKAHKVSCKAVSVNSNNSNADDLNNLYYYCSKGDLDGLQREITRGVSLSAVSDVKLYDAFADLISNRYYECTEFLLKNNANPNAQDTDGITPLYVACIIGLEEFVSLLLRYNANSNIKSKEGLTALFAACQEGHDKCVSLLLQHNADPNIKDSNNDGSPLHTACQQGNDKCVSLLLEHNADPNVVSKDGCTPLYMACHGGYDKCVSLLLQRNADPNIVDKNLVSPLFMACQNDHDKCVALLLQHNADPNIVNNDGASPLLMACQFGHDKCVSLLLHSGVNIGQLICGSTPFLSVCLYGHIKCAALLVEHGANIHARSVPELHSALHLSCMSGNIKMVAYILSLGVDVNAADATGSTPLQQYSMLGMEKFVKLLIEHGADESTMKYPVASNSIALNKISEHYAKNKELRQNAKHCDYPDCCNKGDDNQSLHACSSCHAVYYCSREHQQAHWKEHKKLCKAIKK